MFLWVFRLPDLVFFLVLLKLFIVLNLCVSFSKVFLVFEQPGLVFFGVLHILTSLSRPAQTSPGQHAGGHGDRRSTKKEKRKENRLNMAFDSLQEDMATGVVLKKKRGRKIG